jgi:hypothetical protein
MSGLSIGLAFGLAAAGGVAGLALNFFGGMVSVFSRGAVPQPKSPLRDAFTGAVIGGVVGFGVGYGIEKLTEPKKPTPVIQNDDCSKTEQPEGSIVIRRNENGRSVCTVLNLNGMQPAR